LIPHGSLQPPGDEARLREASQYVPLSGQKEPYDVRSKRSEWKDTHSAPWPFDASLVLVLLLYNRLPDSGVQLFTLIPPIDISEHWPEVTAEVTKRLGESSTDQLKWGLIPGSAGSP
jgi:hypothetical protein